MKKTNNTQPRAVKSRTVIPILKRPVDLILVSFFVINAFFITYVVDVEQLAVPGANPTPGNFEYPVWPPAPGVDLVHWWGRNFDPVLMARPVWWKMTIWIDVIYFGPFYLFAIYAFIKAMFWAGLMFANVTIILGEELMGPHATPTPIPVVGVNLPWLLLPLVVLARMIPKHPFSTKKTKAK